MSLDTKKLEDSLTQQRRASYDFIYNLIINKGRMWANEHTKDILDTTEGQAGLGDSDQNFVAEVYMEYILLHMGSSTFDGAMRELEYKQHRNDALASCKLQPVRESVEVSNHIYSRYGGIVKKARRWRTSCLLLQEHHQELSLTPYHLLVIETIANQSDDWLIGRKEIAKMTGLTFNRVKACLSDLKSLNLIDISHIVKNINGAMFYYNKYDLAPLWERLKSFEPSQQG